MSDKIKENVHEDHRQRLRDKFLANPNSLNKHEVLELLLFYAIPRKNVNPLAHHLLDKFGSVNAVFNAQSNELKSIEGIGDSTVAYITMLGKLLELVAEEEIQEGLKFFNLENVKKYLIKFFSSFDKEVFYAFFLS